jgi:hypothetical protein
VLSFGRPYLSSFPSVISFFLALKEILEMNRKEGKGEGKEDERESF